MDICGDQSGLVALVNQSLELPPPPPSPPSPPPPSILLCDWTRPGAAAASSACQHNPSSLSSQAFVSPRACVRVRACARDAGFAGRDELQRISAQVARSLFFFPKANKPSMHDMSGMQRIPHGLFTQNNPSKKKFLKKNGVTGRF